MSNTNSSDRRTNGLLFRIVAIGMVLYFLFDILKAYFAGGPDGPSLLMVVISCIVLGGGAVLTAVLTWRDWKRSQTSEEAEEEPQEDQLPPAQE